MKTGYLITARLKSTRLKRKILLDVGQDTILDKVILRCKAVSNVDTVVLCTSTNPQDAELECIAQKHKIVFFRGHEDDVLQRLLDAATIENIDRFLSITADNPFHSISAANQIVAFDNENQFDFIFTQNLPIGMSPYFIRTDALKVAVFMKQQTDTEIWGPFVNQPEFFKIGIINVLNNSLAPGLRITCDYPEDYIFIKELYQNLNFELPDLQHIIKLYEQKGDIFTLNSGITQRMPDKETLDTINQTFTANILKGLEFASKHHIKLNPGMHLSNITL